VRGQFTEDWPELGPWVKRQRIARQQNGLTPERLGILADLGFEFGEEAQMTEDWEWRFDSLVELLLMRARSLFSALCMHACMMHVCVHAPWLQHGAVELLLMRARSFLSPLYMHACTSP
jgi:hypothetical protein